MHAALQGWSQEQADELCALTRSEVLSTNAQANMFTQLKKHAPTGQVKLHTPPRLPKHAVQALRAAAVRAFKVILVWMTSAHHHVLTGASGLCCDGMCAETVATAKCVEHCMLRLACRATRCAGSIGSDASPRWTLRFKASTA